MFVWIFVTIFLPGDPLQCNIYTCLWFRTTKKSQFKSPM